MSDARNREIRETAILEATTRPDDVFWMQTYRRIAFRPMTPVIEQIDIEDIAHALGMICRFGGHTREFYSVAEHSVYVSRLCAPEAALAGLLHDAAEAYVGDLIRPIKRSPGMENYSVVEDAILALILEREGLPPTLPHSVKWADNAVLAAERDHPYIVGGAIAPWSALPDAPVIDFGLWSPFGAKRRFIARYRELRYGVHDDVTRVGVPAGAGPMERLEQMDGEA